MSFSVFYAAALHAANNSWSAEQCGRGMLALGQDVTDMKESTFVSTSDNTMAIVGRFTDAATVAKVKRVRDQYHVKNNATNVNHLRSNQPAASPTHEEDDTMETKTNIASPYAHKRPAHRGHKRVKYNNENEGQYTQDCDVDKSKIIKHLGSQLKLAKSDLKFYKAEWELLVASNRQLTERRVDHLIGAWIHSPQPLAREEQGRFAKVGTAIFIRHGVCPSRLPNYTDRELDSLPVRPDICFYKISFVTDRRTLQFTAEIDALGAIRLSPSPYLPTVYGSAGMLHKLTHRDDVGSDQVGDHQVVVCGVIEYMRGMPLDHWLLDREEAKRIADMAVHDRLMELLKIALQLVRGVKHAHTIGIVHRDVKTNNVMIMSPKIYCLLHSQKKLRATAHPYEEDATNAIAKRKSKRTSSPLLPSSGEAKRSLFADGYAASFTFDKKHDQHPAVDDDVAGYRVSLVDYNISIMIDTASRLTLESSQKYNLGVPEYLKQTTEYSVKYKQTTDEWERADDPDMTSAIYWGQYDTFPLVVTILDLLRGVILEFGREGREAHIAAYRKSYLAFCQSQLKKNILPSVYSFLRGGLSEHCHHWWRFPTFLAANRTANTMLDREPRLRDILHRATASRWQTLDRGPEAATMSEPVPSLAEIEIVIIETMAQASVEKKLQLYQLKVVPTPEDGDCVYHTFKQQADLLRCNAAITFTPELSLMLDGPLAAPSSSSSSSSPSRPDHDYVRALRDGLVNWLTLRMMSGESRIIDVVVDKKSSRMVELSKAAPTSAQKAAIDTAAKEGNTSMPDVETVPLTEDQKAVEYARHKHNIEEITMIHKKGKWNNNNGDMVVEMIALMFDVSINVISARFGNRAADIVVNSSTEGRQMMNFYHKINHYEGTIPSNSVDATSYFE